MQQYAIQQVVDKWELSVAIAVTEMRAGREDVRRRNMLGHYYVINKLFGFVDMGIVLSAHQVESELTRYGAQVFTRAVQQEYRTMADVESFIIPKATEWRAFVQNTLAVWLAQVFLIAVAKDKAEAGKLFQEKLLPQIFAPTTIARFMAATIALDGHMRADSPPTTVRATNVKTK